MSKFDKIMALALNAGTPEQEAITAFLKARALHIAEENPSGSVAPRAIGDETPGQIHKVVKPVNPVYHQAFTNRLGRVAWDEDLIINIQVTNAEAGDDAKGRYLRYDILARGPLRGLDRLVREMDLLRDWANGQIRASKAATAHDLPPIETGGLLPKLANALGIAKPPRTEILSRGYASGAGEG